MTNIHVLLIQLPVPNNPATNVPLAAGYLKAYAQAHGLLEHIEIELLPRALADHAGDALLVEAIVARRPDVLGISLYTWNSERSLDIARRVKAQLPNLLVVVGGPEVQRDNAWVLRHPAVDVAVIGEGEQTFADLLRLLIETGRHGGRETRRPADTEIGRSSERVFCLSACQLVSVSGIAFRDAEDNLIVTPERAPLSDLAALPSPYLLGYLELGADGMLMVEISRWCPYACSFCLYGRNMGPKLGSRYFGLERVLAEIVWGRERGATQVHFIEANLNLVPLFWPLMRALADLNADGRLALYAELRGEHLTEEAVAALARAGLRVAEVGLQTANPIALRASHRKTDLAKWAAGTRRLASHGVEVYLDVILGLPADDAAGVAETLDFIGREELGPYDVFTLQVLPGTGVRGQAAEYGLVHQARPPYYVLATNRLGYDDLRRLRRELKLGAGLDPDEVEGCPPPRADALVCYDEPNTAAFWPLSPAPIQRLWLVDADAAIWAAVDGALARLAGHVDVVVRWDAAAALAALLARAIIGNPATLFDCYLLADALLSPAELRSWRTALPYQPGYLDRVAVYRRSDPTLAHDRVSPWLWLVVPWTMQLAPDDYAGVAEIIWTYDLGAGEEPPFAAWALAGGAGVWLRGRGAEEVAEWRAQSGLKLWHGREHPCASSSVYLDDGIFC